MTQPGQELERYRPLLKSQCALITKDLELSVPVEDLERVAETGLLDAAKTFQKRQGTTFSVYAFYKIRGEIYRGLKESSWPDSEIEANYLFQDKANDFLQWYSSSSEGMVKRSTAAEKQELIQVLLNLGIIYLLCKETLRRNEGLESLDRMTTVVIQEAVSTLDARSSELIDLYYFKNSDIQEVARQLATSVPAAHRVHLKILQSIADKLKERGV